MIFTPAKFRMGSGPAYLEGYRAKVLGFDYKIAPDLASPNVLAWRWVRLGWPDDGIEWRHSGRAYSIFETGKAIACDATDNPRLFEGKSLEEVQTILRGFE